VQGQHYNHWQLFMEKELLSSLESAGIDKNHLKKYSAVLTHLRSNKLLLEKWWVLGQPVPDRFNVVGRLPKANLASLGGIFGTKGLGRARVFPKGIINPESFDLHMEFDTKQM
jgi:hypothetical protein